MEKIEIFPDLPKLEYLNLRETKIASIEEVKKLELTENLKELNMLGTPLADELADGIKKEFILLLPEIDLEKVNKDPVTQEDHKEAEELQQERIREEEERKRAAAAEAEGEGKQDE